MPKPRQPVNQDTFKFELLKDKLKAAQEGDGHYLLRAFGASEQAGTLWELYMQLTEIEAAFKTLKSDLHLRPTFLRVIDLKTWQVVGTLDFGKGVRPHCAVFWPRDGLLYVTTELDNSVKAINPQVLKVVRTISTGQPSQTCWSSRAKAVVANRYG